MKIDLGYLTHESQVYNGAKVTLVMQKPEGTGRFDYVAYDYEASTSQGDFKRAVESLEQALASYADERWKKRALDKLEDFYYCIGKMIREDQIRRNGSAPLQEGRTNS